MRRHIHRRGASHAQKLAMVTFFTTMAILVLGVVMTIAAHH